ncbi:MAG TPA: RiPP maturation radical SAM C-methyltransferase [Rhizomicrobium sp.]
MDRLDKHAREDVGCDVCLVMPPFSEVDAPSLGISILASACRARGLDVKVVYGSMLFAAGLGFDDYTKVTDAPFDYLLGERMFVPYAYAGTVVRGRGIVLPQTYKALRARLTDAIEPHLAALVDKILALRPRIVGLSSSFQQTMACMAIAGRVKAAAPDTIVVFGGANAALPMGAGLQRVFPFIDHVFSGDSDIEFPEFCRRVAQGEQAAEPRVFDCKPVFDMAQVHAPDFTDYFEELAVYRRQGTLPADLPRFLVMETSRGCWWGEKHHCTFCGLNGDGMAFRQKSAARVLEEIETQMRRWDCKRINVADNILPRSYFNDVLPALAATPGAPRLFYEVKANLSEDQLDLMAAARVDTVQPGIESLSSPVLKLMRKGVSALQNIALLRGARAREIAVEWNYIYGFPGEAADDYRAVLALFPKLQHLQPPKGCRRIVIDRFSPYHADPEGYAIGRIEPNLAYAGLFPVDAPLHDIAYHFYGDYTTDFLDDKELRASFHAGFARWKLHWLVKSPVLHMNEAPDGGYAITDTRSLAVEASFAASREMGAALRYLERPRKPVVLPADVAVHLDELTRRHFVIEHEGLLMSVVTRRAPGLARRLRKPAAELEMAPV